MINNRAEQFIVGFYLYLYRYRSLIQVRCGSTPSFLEIFIQAPSGRFNAPISAHPYESAMSFSPSVLLVLVSRTSPKLVIAV